MNPQTPFCHNPQCPARGLRGQGNIRMHRQIEQRYRCTTCGQTFAATKGTPFYRLRTPAALVPVVLTLVCHGCPIQALVAALGLDERTVAAWGTRAGQHGQHLHQHVVHQRPLDLQHVQADELWVKLVGRRVWMAMARAVPSRLWLGGVISPQRDLPLITMLVPLIRSCAGSLALLVCVDGLASSVTAFLRVFRHPVRTGRRGRPRLGLEQGRLLGQMGKRYARGRVVSVEHRGIRGTVEAIAAVLAATKRGSGINTAYIERLNATFRASLAPLVRRGRAIVHTAAILTAGMWLGGCADNFCRWHESLRVQAPAGAWWKWQERTPAMAAGLTNHRWTMRELLRYQVALPPWVAPKRRGRPRKRAQQPAMALAT
jgi:transposase-like protein